MLTVLNSEEYSKKRRNKRRFNFKEKEKPLKYWEKIDKKTN